MQGKDSNPKQHIPLEALKCALEENGILIDRRILATVEDLDTAVVLGFALWVELATRDPDNGGAPVVIDTAAPWAPPRGCDTFSHWFVLNISDTIILLEHSISRARLRSALRYLVQDLLVMEAQRQTGVFPATVEYRINFDQLSLWMNIPRPEDYDAFQRSRPQKRKFIMPRIHPLSGKLHGWYYRDTRTCAALGDVEGLGQK